MSKIFLIHGSFGNPSGNWFPWLKKELENLGHEVYVPQFPTPKNQSLESWNKVFATLLQKINKDTIFIGHSLGPSFILNTLEQINIPVKACFFVSGFIQFIGNPTFDEVNKTFVDRQFNWESIQSNCKDFHIYHGDNDPYVSLKYAKNLAQKVGTKVQVIPNGGHLNAESGFTKFEKLLKDIKNIPISVALEKFH